MQNVGIMRVGQTVSAVEIHFLPSVCILHHSDTWK